MQDNDPRTEAARAGSLQGVSRRQMTVLFCDLVGSTSLSDRLDPEDLLDALSAYHAVVRKVAARFSGFVARITGDGVDLYFGYPVAGEDDAVRAVHAGLAIVEAVGNMAKTEGESEAMSVRVGIATGLVAVSTRDSVSIAGTTPNLAASARAIRCRSRARRRTWRPAFRPRSTRGRWAWPRARGASPARSSSTRTRDPLSSRGSRGPSASRW